MKKGFVLLRSWRGILGVLMFSMLIFLVGWKAADVLAQNAGGSEAGAKTLQTEDTPGAKLTLSTPPVEAGPFVPSEAGSNAMGVGETGSDQRTQALPSGGASPYGPSEGGTNAPASPDPAMGATAAWPTHWYTIVGTAFIPSDSGITYQYGYNGCVRPTSNGFWRASINVPDGSVLKFIYFNYENDVNSMSSTAWVTAYKYDGTTYDLGWVTSRPYSTTGTGYYFDLSAEFTSTVNNLTYGYVFIWSGANVTTPATQATQRLCSVQVGYIPPPVFGVALPLITK